jgi:hypothetical protein
MTPAEATHEPEEKRLRNGIIALLQKFGGYEPAVDDILVNEIASCTIYWKKLEALLDAPTATPQTYSHIADAKIKFQKMAESALEKLALTRRDRIGQQGASDLESQLREARLKAKQD